VLEWPPYATAQAVTEGARAPAAALITPKCEKKCQCNGCAASDLSRHSSSGLNLSILSSLGEAQSPRLRLQQGLLELVEFQMWGLAKCSHASLLEIHDGSLLRTQTDIQSAQ